MAEISVTVGGDRSSSGGRHFVKADDTGYTWELRFTSRDGSNVVGPDPLFLQQPRVRVRGFKDSTNPARVLGFIEAWSNVQPGETVRTVEGVATAAPVVEGLNGKPPRRFDNIYREPTQLQYLNRELVPQFLADLETRVKAGEVTVEQARAITEAAKLPWAPPPGLENAIWLPPGGGDVPFALQSGAVTVTGEINPRVYQEQKYLQGVLDYTAEKTGRSYSDLAAQIGESLKTQNPNAPKVDDLVSAVAQRRVIEDPGPNKPLVDESGGVVTKPGATASAAPKFNARTVALVGLGLVALYAVFSD